MYSISHFSKILLSKALTTTAYKQNKTAVVSFAAGEKRERREEGEERVSIGF